MADQGDRRHWTGLGSSAWDSDNDSFGLSGIVSTVMDPGAIGSSSIADPFHSPPVQAEPGADTPAPPQEIVFIDGAVPDAQLLAAGVNPGVRAVILDPNQDGVAQIAAYLANNNVQGLSAIAIVSHGADGVLFLGSAVLDTDTIGQYQSQLAQIGAALQTGGGLLLYGCDVAQDAAGVAFVDQLSAATGGANIAASSHVVGSADQGGSFTLDVNTGQVAAPTPFTAQTQADFSGVLPTAVNQLYFTVSNLTPTSSANRVNQIGVSGAGTVGTATDLIDGSQATFGNGTTVISLPGVAVDPATGKFFFTDTNSNATFNKIYSGSLASPGTVSAILSTPTTTTQLQGLAIDQPNGNLYYALNASTAGSIGIYEVSETGGTATEVVSGFTSAAHALFQIALDTPDNLVFFADSPGLTSVSTLWVGNLISHTETALATSAKGSRLEGVAYNNGTVYWSTLNGGTVADNNIMSSAVTITGSGSTAAAALVGTTSTLYAGAATGNGTIANTPTSLAVDSVTGILYSGSNITTSGTFFAVVNAGTVTGGSSMTTIFSSAFSGTAASGAPGVALALESTPTVTSSGTVTYVTGGSAVAINSSASVSNPDGFNLASATVAITGGTFTNDGDTLTATTSGTSILASFSGETLTLSGNDTLAHYKQVLDSVAFKSTAADPGNGTSNLTRTVSWTVSDGVITSTTPTSTIKIHGLPTVTASGTVSFTGGGSGTILDPGLTVSDIYSTTLASATVTIGGFITGDTLTVGTLGGLTPSFSNGTLTLTGSATLATYQTALDSVQYGFTSGGDPTGGGSHTTRSISWSVNDGTTTSSAASSALNLIHAAPTVTTAGTIVYGGGSGPVALDPTLTVTAPDSGNLLSSATISVTAGAFPSDGDVFNVDVTGLAITPSINNGVITLTGTDTVADYQQALRSITIDTSGADPTGGGAHPTRTISWLINDGVVNSAVSTSTAQGTFCFCAGTMILTPQGEVAVERLLAGDLVVTERGDIRRIEWLGRGHVAVKRGHRNAATPVIVRKGAFAPNVPHKDLHVTKGHAFHFEGVLIPVEFLINYRTILWDDHAQDVELYHIELETHDVLVANGAPAESYRDDGNRWLFSNANQAWNLPAKETCAPVLTGGPLVDAVWQKLLERAGARPNLVLTDDPNLHLMVDGRLLYPATHRNDLYVFQLNDRRGKVSIISRDAIPAELGLMRDFRSLGVALKQIGVRKGTRIQSVPANDPRLVDGFHDFEQHDGIRWTNGAASLPSSMFEGITGPIDLLLTVPHTARYIDDGDTRVEATARWQTGFSNGPRRAVVALGNRRNPCDLASLAAPNRQPPPQPRATTIS